jgi:hypothetical protein
MSCSYKMIPGMVALGLLGGCVTMSAQVPANLSATGTGPGPASFSPSLSASAGFSASGGSSGGGGGSLRRNNARQTGLLSPSLASAGSLLSRHSTAFRGSSFAAVPAPYQARSSALPPPPMAVHVAAPSSYSGIHLGLSGGSGGAAAPSWGKSSQGSEPAYAFVLRHEGARGMSASSHGPKSDRKKKDKGDVVEQLLRHRSY